MTTRNIQHTLRIYRPRFIPSPDGPQLATCEHWWMIDQRCYWCGKGRYRGNTTKG